MAASTCPFATRAATAGSLLAPGTRGGRARTRDPQGYDELLRQRVEANYLAGALMMPEQSTVELLHVREGRSGGLGRGPTGRLLRELRSRRASIHQSRHRASGIPVHFLKVSASGVLTKAYENDDVKFPQDALGTPEGQRVCRQWSARQVFERDDRYAIYHQYTDKPNGTYWCTSAVQSDVNGDFSVSVGTAIRALKVVPRSRHDYSTVLQLPRSVVLPFAPTSELESRWAEPQFARGAYQLLAARRHPERFRPPASTASPFTNFSTVTPRRTRNRAPRARVRQSRGTLPLAAAQPPTNPALRGGVHRVALTR